MFATRNHDENAIHQQQTAAAAKPLNQGVKGLAPKTPANKASKVRLNDENVAFGKTGGKGKDVGLLGDQKGGKAERSAFVTPAGPRTRAPLGNKTTNAKATAFQTPADEKPSSVIKHTSPRLRRAKVKIHTAEADPLNADTEEREIEYMPPREVPLPDYPDDWPHNRTYPQFEGKNLTRGWWGEFAPKKDVDSDAELSDYEEKFRKAEEGRKKREAKGPATVKAKGAASALTAPAKQRGVPSFAAPTAAVKARLPSAPVARKPASSALASQANVRHIAAKVASNTTLGYSKGRAVSATARKPLSSIHEKPTSREPAAKAPSSEMLSAGGSTFDELFGLQNVAIGCDNVEEDDLGGLRGDAVDLVDDELDDFQLDPVEL